jgi:hypothetical protein
MAGDVHGQQGRARAESRDGGTGSRMHAGYIEKHTCLQFLLVETMFDQIADANDAPQLVVFDNRQMTDPSRRHCRKHGIGAIRGAAAQDGRRHQFLDFKAEYRGAIPGDRVDKVSLREDADRFHPAILDDQGADAMFSQLADRKFDTVRKVDPYNIMTFGP